MVVVAQKMETYPAGIHSNKITTPHNYVGWSLPAA